MICKEEPFSIAKYFQRKNAINLSPEYQRQANAWTRTKKLTFLDTLFRGYDVPKIYLHELPKNGGLHTYALVDGKQRLQCIWDFLDDQIPLGESMEDFVPTDRDQQANRPYPKAGDCFSGLDSFWQDEFKSIPLSTVVIHDADIDDIEDLFGRLNDGEPLNSAEKRNAKGGSMCRLIRELADEHDFFKEVLPIRNKRDRHRDLVARFLLIENGIRTSGEPYCTIKKIFLDALVVDNKRMGEADIKKLKASVFKQLNALCKIFGKKSHLLKKAGYAQLYYLFAKEMEKHYASEKLFSEIGDFLVYFDEKRAELRADDNEQHEANDDNIRFGRFERLTQQANDKNSLEDRVEFMKEFFLKKYPGTKLRDPKRNFSDAERRVLYYRSGNKCAECGKEFKNFGDFYADHVVQWAHGGQTTLANAQALCNSCNAKKNKKVA